MSDSEEKQLPDEYEVRFNFEVAFTLVYEDGRGQLIFIFELGSNPKEVFLHRRPLENYQVLKTRDSGIQVCLDLAFERAKRYVESCGYKVDVFEN